MENKEKIVIVDYPVLFSNRVISEHDKEKMEQLSKKFKEIYLKYKVEIIVNDKPFRELF